MRRRVILHATLLVLCGAPPAWARITLPGPGGATAPRSRAAALTTASISMDQAVKMAEQRYHARVVKAETQKDNGHTVYVLRLLNDSGRVWTVRVDAASGAVL